MNITKLVVKKGLKNISHYSYDFHMFTAIIHHFEGLFGSNDQLPVSLLAQLVERCTGHRFKFRTGLMFSTTSSVVFIAARIDSIKGS